MNNVDHTADAWETKYTRGILGGDAPPDPVLVQYAFLMPQGRVLDVGAGEGRHALFFSKMGYDVHAVDISQTAVKRCMEKAERENLSLDVDVCSIFDFEIKPGDYDWIIASEFLHAFKKSECTDVIPLLKQGLKKNGLFYLSVFSTDDPNCRISKATQDEIEENTFYHKEARHWVHYFRKEEILDHFSGWNLIHCCRARNRDPGHGNTGPHDHWFITYLGRSPG